MGMLSLNMLAFVGVYRFKEKQTQSTHPGLRNELTLRLVTHLGEADPLIRPVGKVVVVEADGHGVHGVQGEYLEGVCRPARLDRGEQVAVHHHVQR